MTIGGVAATNVRVLGTTTIQAVTGAHAAGARDVVVTVADQAATTGVGLHVRRAAGADGHGDQPDVGYDGGGTSVTHHRARTSPRRRRSRFGGVAAASVDRRQRHDASAP